MAEILIVEDEAELARVMAEAVQHLGHNVDTAATIRECREWVAGRSYDVVFLDIRLPDGSGLEIIEAITHCPGHPEVIIMTGYGNPDSAMLAINSGAWDYLEKPIPLSDLTLSLSRAIQYRQAHLGHEVRETFKRGPIVGTSPAIERCLNLAAQAAAVDVNVLITGESGTGKEMIAHAIHENSHRAVGPFVIVDCASLPADIVEGILFGHEKGVFTGADRAREGLIQQANGGTLFLDEIGELPPNIQKAFLRVLQEGTFRPLGSKREFRSDFRLVAATNRNLDEEIRKGLFREDLFYRIRSVTIDLPPLRDRREDINTLILHYLDELCKRYRVDAKGFSPEFLELARQYAWPGNIRELIRVMERALVMASRDPIIYPKHLPSEIRVNPLRGTEDREVGEIQEHVPELLDIRAYRRDADRRYFRNLIRRTGGAMQEMVRISGLSQAQLYNQLKAHGLNRQSIDRQ